MLHKLIIFSVLIACALATWAPSSSRQEHPHGPHQGIATHKSKLGHGEHPAAIGHGREAHGQLESVHHGGGTSYHDKEFRRVKKIQHNKHPEGSKGRNQLRRVHSRKHYRH